MGRIREKIQHEEWWIIKKSDNKDKKGKMKFDSYHSSKSFSKTAMQEWIVWFNSVKCLNQVADFINCLKDQMC